MMHRLLARPADPDEVEILQTAFTRFHTRAWKRNFLSVSAPTGHKSAMLPW